MRAVVLTMLAAVLASGCSVEQTSLPTPRPMVVVNPSGAEIYAPLAGAPGPIRDRAPLGTPLEVSGTWTDLPRHIHRYYLIEWSGDPAYVRQVDADAAWVRQPSTFSLPRRAGEEAWQRLDALLDEPHITPVAVREANLVETSAPARPKDVAYRISRREGSPSASPSARELFLTIEVSAYTHDGAGRRVDSEDRARQAAWFLRTGETPYPRGAAGVRPERSTRP